MCVACPTGVISLHNAPSPGPEIETVATILELFCMRNGAGGYGDAGSIDVAAGNGVAIQ